MGLFKPAWQSKNEKKALKYIETFEYSSESSESTLNWFLRELIEIEKSAPLKSVRERANEKRYNILFDIVFNDARHKYSALVYEAQYKIRDKIHTITEESELSNIIQKYYSCRFIKSEAESKLLKIREAKCEHIWVGCKCSSCGKVRDEQHNWNGCICSRCGKRRDEQHDWNGIKCRRCHRERDDICDKCGGKYTITLWAGSLPGAQGADYECIECGFSYSNGEKMV